MKMIKFKKSIQSKLEDLIMKENKLNTMGLVRSVLGVWTTIWTVEMRSHLKKTRIMGLLQFLTMKRMKEKILTLSILNMSSSTAMKIFLVSNLLD